MRYRLAAALDAWVERVERSHRLDPVADKLAVAGNALKPGRVKDVLSGTPFGHPAHPVLVTVPIGSWVTATYLDVAGGPQGRVAAQRAIGLGVVSALPTVATGLSDWLDTSGAQRRVGLVHGSVNDVAVGLFSASWVARRRGRYGLGVGLSAAGLTLLAAGGWLGGHLAYAQGVGVDTTAFQMAPDDWADVGAIADLSPGQPTLATAAGVPVLLVRRGPTVRVLADRCTHRGAPLHEGETQEDCIVCPWHHSVFSLHDGRVVRGPATRPQPVFECRVVDDRVQVRRANQPRSLPTNPAGV